MIRIANCLSGWALPLLVLACVSAAAPAYAQRCALPPGPGGACEVDLDLALPVPESATLAVSSTDLDWGHVTDEDYDRGYRDYVGPKVTVEANAPYVVQLQVASHFRVDGSPSRSTEKSVSDVFWGTSPGAFPHRMSPGTHAIMRGGPGPERGGSPDTERLYFRVLWDRATNPPGTYNLDLRLTLTTP
jgi:hypothetical protein